MEHVRSNQREDCSLPSKASVAAGRKRFTVTAAKLAALSQLSWFFFVGQLSADPTCSGSDFRSGFPDGRSLMESAKEKHREYPILVNRAKELNENGMTVEKKKKGELFSEALACADNLIARYPDSAMPYCLKSLSSGNLAAIRSGKEKVALSRQTVQFAKKAIELDPRFAQPHIILGIYYREVAQASGFLKSMAKRMYGGFPEGTLKDSERALLTALSLAPNDIFAHFEMGKTYVAMKRNDKAKAHLDRVLGFPGTSNLNETIRQSALDTLKKLHS